ncbi:MAG: type II secretion system F family protein [Candidatus Muiribacteriota bacterium]
MAKVFYYSARGEDDRITTGTFKGESNAKLREYLNEQKLVLISAYESPGVSFWKISTISDRTLMLFTNYFSTMVKAGISAYKSINILEKQEKNTNLKEKLSVISHDIKNGSTLYEAFGRFNDTFGNVYLGLLRTGEESGRLSELLQKCSNLIETRINIRRKVLSILSYPLIICFLVSVLIFIIFMQIVPKFQTLYGQMGLSLEDLPMLTKIVIRIADFIRVNIFYEISFVLIAVATFYQFYSTESGKLAFDRFLVKIPVIKDLIIKYFMARFARNLSVLFESGFSIIVAFERSLEIISNMAVKEKLLKVLKFLENGKTITEAFDQVDLVPDMTREMIMIGEQTASFDQMLNNIADFYEKDLEYATETFMNWIEPSIIVVLGFLVGTIMLSVYLPIFSLASKMNVAY